jgi:hypothetical protein
MQRPVREAGLEPARPKTQVPKTCVSANSTTPAWGASLGDRPQGQERLRSRMSFATCPVALTLYCATSTRPVGPTTIVDLMTPVTVLP